MIEFFRILFSSVWELFSIKWPGFGFSFGAVALGAVAAVFSLKVLGMILGISFSPGGFLDRLHGGNNRKIKINKDRRGDTK